MTHTTYTRSIVLLIALFITACSTLEKATDVTSTCMPELQQLRACIKDQVKQAPPAPTK